MQVLETLRNEGMPMEVHDPLFLGISLGLCPREIPRSSPASPWETPSFPPLLLRLTQSVFLEVWMAF